MKIIPITISLCLFATASLLAQGRINFNNTSATPLRIYSFNLGGVGPVVIGTASTAVFGIGPASVEVRLYAGLTPSSLAPVLIGPAANAVFVLNTASTIASAQGTFLGGNPLSLPGFDGSTPVFLQFSADSGHYHGRSPIIQVTPSLAPAAAPSVFSTTADASHWDGLTIDDIPEPSSGALLAFGALVLATFSSRKRAVPERTTNP